MDKTLYRVTYTRTNIANTTFSANGAAQTRRFSLSAFTLGGDTTHTQREYVNATFKHYHTNNNTGYANSSGIKMRSFVTDSAGNSAYSPWQTWNTFSTSSPISKTDTIANVNALTPPLASVSVECAAYNKNCSLYYRAASGAPMVLTLDFYDIEEPQNIAKAYVNGAWVDCEPFVYIGGEWKAVSIQYYNGSTWVDCSH